MYEKLFSEIKIRGLTLKNRIVMPAMGTHFADEDSQVTQQLIDYQTARAKGGCGLNFMECTSVCPDATHTRQPGISDDRFIPGHRKCTEAIHEAGGTCAIQLWAPGAGAGSDPKCRIYLPDGYDGKKSAVFIPPTAKREPDGTIPAVTGEELETIVRWFGEAAARSVAAGYDVLEFHCGHNYLPHTMLSKAFNHRTDEYGGSLENRMRFPLACIRAIRANMPEEMPLFIRVSVFDEDDLDDGRGGNSIEETIQFLKEAKKAGVDVANVSRGNFTGWGNVYEVPPLNLKPGFNVENAARIRRETGLVTMAVGRINTPELGEKILAEEKADLICMGRAQLADSDFCKKCRDGRTDEIRYCVGCNQGCNDGFVSLPHITCLRNPLLGRESVIRITEAKEPKKVLVIGGGMGGMECALFLKARGHEPILIEKSDHLGGQFLLAGQAPGKEEFVKAARDEAEMVRKAGIRVELNREFEESMLDEYRIDEAVIATGAGPLILPFPGVDGPHVSNAHDVLRGTAVPKGDTVVIGGGLVGVEIAELLSERGHKCTIIEMRDAVASGLGYYRMMFTMKNIAEKQIDCIVNASCKEITENSVRYEQDGEIREVPCESVVIAVGAKTTPHDHILSACEKRKIPVHKIGDAVKVRRALDAIAEGVETALEI